MPAILFTLFNDFKTNFQQCNINLFADDTTIYIVGKDINELVEIMNQELSIFNKWLNVNKLKLNAMKTNYMVLGNSNIEEVNQIKIGNAVIERALEIKYLGCFIDERLNFNGNCDYVCKKLAKRSKFIRSYF